jgi:hypothetical protein
LKYRLIEVQTTFWFERMDHNLIVMNPRVKRRRWAFSDKTISLDHCTAWVEACDYQLAC